MKRPPQPPSRRPLSTPQRPSYVQPNSGEPATPADMHNVLKNFAVVQQQPIATSTTVVVNGTSVSPAPTPAPTALSNDTPTTVTPGNSGNPGSSVQIARGDHQHPVTSLPVASTTVLGITELSVAPVNPATPIAVGDNDPRIVNAITSLTGDATATGPGAAATTLATVNASPGTSGDASHTSQVATNGKGLVTSNVSVAIQIAESQVTGLVTGLATLVAGPSSSTDNALARWDGTTGRLVQDTSVATLTDDGGLVITGTQPGSVATTPGTSATSSSISGGQGGETTNTVAGTGGIGASVNIIAGKGGPANGVASGVNTAGAAGTITIQGGPGGLATNGATNVPTAGGRVTVIGGTAALASGGAGGPAVFSGGDGSNTSTGGAGGNFSLNGGNAGGDQTVDRGGGTLFLVSGNSRGSSAGAQLKITAGNGGTGTGTAGATGGQILQTAGTGGAGSSTGGNGGQFSANGGTAGTGGTSPGNGGSAQIQGGAAASQAGSAGGNANLMGAVGTSSGTGGAGGSSSLTGGNAGGDNTVNRTGGAANVTAGTSKGSSSGAAVTVTGGTGGIGTGTAGATGGAVNIVGGVGGAGSATGGVGGALNLRGGVQGAGGTAGGGAIVLQVAATTALANALYIANSGNIYVGTSTAPTAYFHLKAGTATASTAPIKLTTGTVLSSIEDGAMEYAASHLYFSIGSTRYQLDQQGTVTSVALSLPSFLTVSGSPVTGSGTLTAVLATQTANTVFAGPSSGAAAAPTFRALASADIPALPSHIISSGSAPTIAIGTDTVAASITGNDTAGTITLTGQVVGAIGTLCTVTFNSAFGSTPKAVMITAATGGASLCSAYVSALSTSAFTLSNGTATTTSVSLIYYYFVIG